MGFRIEPRRMLPAALCWLTAICLSPIGARADAVVAEVLHEERL